MSASRRALLAMTVVLALLLALASLAWACTGPTYGVPATFTLASGEGQAGSTVTAKGTGWRSRVEIRWGHEGGALLAEPVGPDFSQPITIPRTAAAGTHYVFAVPGGSSPAMTASVLVTRAADPPAVQPLPTPRPLPPATGGESTTRGATSSRRAKAVAACKRRYSPRRARTATKKRRLVRKRAACIRKTKKRYPLGGTSSFSSPLAPPFA